MVSSDTARVGIIRRAKSPQLPPIIRYRDVRGPVCSYLTDMNRSLQPLLVAEDMFTQRMSDPSESTLRQDDARNSIAVLHGVQALNNQLGGFQFVPAPTQQPRLILEGVEISIRADLLVVGERSGIEQIGAAVLRMTQSDQTSEVAIQRRREMGTYVATLARLHTESHLSNGRAPANRLCMSIDVQHGEIFAAPTSATRRMNDLASACRFIASLWPTL